MLLYSNYPTLTLPYFNFIGEGGLTIAPKTVNIWYFAYNYAINHWAIF